MFSRLLSLLGWLPLHRFFSPSQTASPEVGDGDGDDVIGLLGNVGEVWAAGGEAGGVAGGSVATGEAGRVSAGVSPGRQILKGASMKP